MNSESVESPSTSTSILVADSVSSSSTSVDLTLTETPRRKIKGLKWKHHEDVQLCRAWLNVSTDAGTSQKMTWEGILKEYESDSNFKNTRPRESLLGRWNTIRREVGKFCSNLAQIRAHHQSRIHPKNELKEAKAMYMALETNNRPFILEHCYEILATHAKWEQLWDVSKEKTGASKRKINNEEEEIKEEASHPVSCMKAELANQKTRRLDSYIGIIAANQERRNVADLEMNTLLQTMVDDACMAIDASAISDPMRREYFLKRQKTIMERE